MLYNSVHFYIFLIISYKIPIKLIDKDWVGDFST